MIMKTVILTLDADFIVHNVVVSLTFILNWSIIHVKLYKKMRFKVIKIWIMISFCKIFCIHRTRMSVITICKAKAEYFIIRIIIYNVLIKPTHKVLKSHFETLHSSIFYSIMEHISYMSTANTSKI